MKRATLIIVLALMHCVAFSQGWFELGTGSRGLPAVPPILSICADDSGNIYAAPVSLIDSSGTYFSGSVYGVEKWDAKLQNWSQLGYGATGLRANDYIYSICVDRNHAVYAAGEFTDTNSFYVRYGETYVAKYDPISSTWSKLGVYDTFIYSEAGIIGICTDTNNNVYAIGFFSDSVGTWPVAMWNSTTSRWIILGRIALNSNVACIAVDDSGDTYIAGEFTDSLGYTYVAKYNAMTQEWTEVGRGFHLPNAYPFIHGLSCSHGDGEALYAAVCFHDSTTSMILGNVYKWDGSDWVLLGGSTAPLNANNEFDAIATGADGIVYASGSFTDSAGYTYVAVYSPASNSWSELGSGSGSLHRYDWDYARHPTISTLCLDPVGHVFAAGEFIDTTEVHTYSFVAEYGINNLFVQPETAPDGSILVFPNPTSGLLTVKINDEFDMFSIYALSGKLMKNGIMVFNNNHEATVDLSSFKYGEYILTIKNSTFKILKTN